MKKKKEKERLQKWEYRSSLDECSKKKAREYDRKRKNNAKNVHLSKNNKEANHDVNCDLKSNCNGKNGKLNHNGKCDVKHNVKSYRKYKQDNKQSTRRCK